MKHPERSVTQSKDALIVKTALFEFTAFRSRRTRKAAAGLAECLMVEA
jgi:hypothetical protein